VLRAAGVWMGGAGGDKTLSKFWGLHPGATRHHPNRVALRHGGAARLPG